MKETPARKVAFATVGCKVNQYDTEALAARFRGAGWQVVDFREAADVYVVNTCAVTARSEADSRRLVRQSRRTNPGALVVLCGCYPQVRGAEALGATGADVVLGTRDRGDIVSLVERALAGERGLLAVRPYPGAAAQGVRAGTATGTGAAGGPAAAAEGAGAWCPPGSAVPYEELPVAERGRTRAVVKVQEGCDVRCTYCIVPAARGPGRSRDPEAALDEVRRLVRAGFREVVLTGIQLGAYGRDLGMTDGLAVLLDRVAATPGLWRVRLSSVEPVDVTDRLLGVMAGREAVCPHLHLPLQSGSDRILAAMGRPYRTADYLRLVERARERVPGLALSTDVMVGFPGETDADFAATLHLVERAGFMRLHVFPYSPRPGTPAAGFPGQVPEQVKKERARQLAEAGCRLALAFHRGLVGSVVEVLAERAQGGVLSGLTRSYVRTFFAGGRELEGCLVAVAVREASAEGVRGGLVEVLREPDAE